MKKTQSSSDPKRSIRVLILFCLAVGILIIGSLCIRLFALMRESTFDPEYRYTMAFIHKKEVDIIFLDPISKSMSHMIVRGEVDKSTVFSQTGILVDAVFSLPETFSDVRKVENYINDALLHKRGVVSTLSSYDLFRLSLFSKGISDTQVKTEEVILPIESANLDILAQELFLDQQIADENVSISVVNGAGVAGLGKRLERALNNRGFNVISVANAEKIVSSSGIVYSGEKGYSVKKLENILGVRAVLSEEQSLSDIIVTLGRDQANVDSF